MAKRKGTEAGVADPKRMKKLYGIAKVSAQLFSTKGYMETSVDDIAAAAKITKGGVYHYFPSKSDILFFICSTYVDFDLEGLEDSLREIETPSEKIKFIISRHIAHYAQHVFAARTLVSESYNLPPRYHREVKARERLYFKIMTQALSEAVGGKNSKVTMTALAFILFGMMNWAYFWFNPRGEMKPAELSQLIYEVFMNGVNGPALNSQGEPSEDGLGVAAIGRPIQKGQHHGT
jgi:TetR/AcrR family transcriptional regulator, cholesterol catabolism regulator